MKPILQHFAYLLATGLACFYFGVSAQAAAPFADWPQGASPEVVGKEVAEKIAGMKFNFEVNPRRTSVIYPEVIAWYGALRFARLTGDKSLQVRLTNKFDQFLTPDGAKRISDQAHVDSRVLGAVPLELYIQTKDSKYLVPGIRLANKQWEPPGADGLSPETRYWIDDMYMITLLQVQAFRATGERKYLDRAAIEMSSYLDKLQQPNGLFFHAPDVPFYWGRGNGWVAAGMAELLSELPADHPQRRRIMDGYTKMMRSLLKCQMSEGTWRQLLDQPESWPETSSTGMFTFAMITGVNAGWLDIGTYGPAARKGWLALVANMNANHEIQEVCAGTDKLNSLEHYMTRPRRTGDLHGSAPILWSAAALLKNQPH